MSIHAAAASKHYTNPPESKAMSDNDYAYPSQGVPYPLQGMNPTFGLAIYERAGHAARELAPLSSKQDAFMGKLGKIVMTMLKGGLPDVADDLIMLAELVRE